MFFVFHHPIEWKEMRACAEEKESKGERDTERQPKKERNMFFLLLSFFLIQAYSSHATL